MQKTSIPAAAFATVLGGAAVAASGSSGGNGDSGGSGPAPANSTTTTTGNAPSATIDKNVACWPAPAAPMAPSAMTTKPPINGAAGGGGRSN